MEEAIWVIVGIISVLLTFGIVIQFTQNKFQDDKINSLQHSMDALSNRCNAVCKSPTNTYLNSRAPFPPESILTLTQTSLCVQFEDRNICRTCDCDLKSKSSSNTLFNLTGLRASGLDVDVNFVCFFEKISNNVVEVDCRG